MKFFTLQEELLFLKQVCFVECRLYCRNLFVFNAFTLTARACASQDATAAADVFRSLGVGRSDDISSRNILASCILQADP